MAFLATGFLGPSCSQEVWAPALCTNLLEFVQAPGYNFMPRGFWANLHPQLRPVGTLTMFHPVARFLNVVSGTVFNIELKASLFCVLAKKRDRICQWA